MKTGKETKRGHSAQAPERQAPLSPLVACALEGGSGTLRSRLGRIQNFTPAPGRYTLLGEIAKGGMGQVQRVWDEVLDRELAVKRVALEVDDKASSEIRLQHAWKLERFIEEARVTGQLEHPGIVPIHDIALDEEGKIFFTMPLVQGDTLKTIFKLARNRLQGWTIHRALGVIHKVCQTVAFAHQSGVVHRDLKPENIMVGRFGEVYVMDWGLALILGKSDRESVVGTPAYMSPEQATGKVDDVGPQSDVYSVGALLYELFAGRMPHEVSLEEERAVGRTLDDILSRPPRPLNQVARRAPPELTAIVDKAMAPAPRDRYAGMLELADDLSAWLEGRVVHAYDSRMMTRWRKWRRRNRPLAYALDALVLLTITSVTVIIAQQRSQIREVQAAYDKIEANAYIANIAAADLGLRAHKSKASKRRLEACADGPRGWEWGHLHRLADASVHTLRGHGGAVRSVDVSSDGRYIATASDDRTARLWDGESFQLVHELRGHGDIVTQVAFHPQGHELATASWDERVRIWDVATGRCIRVVDDHAFDVITLAYDPEGRLLLSADIEGHIVVTWLRGNLESTILRPGAGDITALAYDPVREVIVARPHGGDQLLLLDPETGFIEGTVTVDDNIRDIAIDPQGKRYAVAAGRTIMIIDADTLTVEKLLSGHSETIKTLAFDGSGKHLASGGFDNVVHLWDTSTGDLRLSFDGHDLDINSIAFYPDQVRLVSASEDDTARIWSQTAGACLVLEGHGSWVNAVDFSSDGKRIISGGLDKTVRTWDAVSGQQLSAVQTSEGVASLARATNALAYGYEHGRLHLSTSGNTEISHYLRIGKGYPRVIAFDREGTKVLQKSSEGMITAHELPSERLIFEWKGKDDGMFSLAMHPDGLFYAVGSKEGTVEFRTTDSNELVHTTNLNARGVQVLAYDSTGSMLAAGTSESTIHLIPTATREPAQVLSGHEKIVTALSFSPDGKRLASGSFDETLRIWDTRGGLLLTLLGHTQPITEINFDPAGTNIVSASKDGTIRLWRGR